MLKSASSALVASLVVAVDGRCVLHGLSVVHCARAPWSPATPESLILAARLVMAIVQNPNLTKMPTTVEATAATEGTLALRERASPPLVLVAQFDRFFLQIQEPRELQQFVATTHMLLNRDTLLFIIQKTADGK